MGDGRRASRMKGRMCPGDAREMFDGADSIKNEHASRKCSEDVMLRLADASLDVPGEYAATRAGRANGRHRIVWPAIALDFPPGNDGRALINRALVIGF
ncbi:hypothetical protein EYA82_28695 [Burkholderia pseudomallei]|nr:hypothetical protein EYA82_28695 [Burkholderia pseudomallei]